MSPLRSAPHLVDVALTFPRHIPFRHRVIEQARRFRVVLHQGVSRRLEIPNGNGEASAAAPRPAAIQTEPPPRDGGGHPMRITCIGRGHSGTRAFGELMRGAGVELTVDVEQSCDYVGGCAMYEAARIFGAYVDRTGEYSWDFSRAIEAPIPDRFVELIERYLEPVDGARGHAAWKLPETTLVFPWLVRLRPQVRYVHWVRDPRDAILGAHLTDDLTKFGAPVAYRGVRWLWNRDAALRRRAVSWKYQHDLIEQSPKPAHWLVVRYEDFVDDPAREAGRISEFLDLPLPPAKARKGRVGLWRGEPLPELPLLDRHLQRYGYL